MRRYFRLGALASVFSDYVSGLKVTKNVPGSTIKPLSNLTKAAIGNGHISEIEKDEYDAMMEAITPEERKAAYEEQGYNPEEKVTEAAAGAPADEHRAGLLARLKKIKMTNSKRAEAQEMGNDELEAFLESEEK
jgi:hypothetical protein